MGPGLHPQYTRAQFAGEAVGGLTNSTSPMTHKQNKRMPGTLVSAQLRRKMIGSRAKEETKVEGEK